MVLISFKYHRANLVNDAELVCLKHIYTNFFFLLNVQESIKPSAKMTKMLLYNERYVHIYRQQICHFSSRWCLYDIKKNCVMPDISK